MNTKNPWQLLLGMSDEDWERTQSGFRQIATELSSFREKVGAVVIEFNNFVETHKPAIERVVSIIEDKEAIHNLFSKYLTTVHKQLLEHGYFIGLAGWGFSYVNEIVKLLHQGEQDAIDSYLLGLLKVKDNVDQMTEKWCENQYFHLA